MTIIKLLSSPTCVPCKILAKRLDDLGVKYTKINAVDYPEYGVRSTPHIIIEKDGEVLRNEHVGNINEVITYIRNL